MREIAPGLWHWTRRHPRIGSDVSSYYLAAERVLLDPMLPPGGLGWFESAGAPEHILLSNRHHDRQSWELVEAFGCTVHCVSAGCEELGGRGPVSPFEFGDELPGEILAHEVGAICPDETAFYSRRHSALACADGVVNRGGGSGLSFVPDGLMDDPQATKQGLTRSYIALLALDFELLLLAHGEPVTSGAHAALESFVTDG